MTTAVAKREPRGMRGWDPFHSLRDEVEALWSHVVGNRANNGLTAMHIPPLDVKETQDAVEVRVDLPGFKADDVTVQIINNVLTISGQRVEESKKDTETYHRIERLVGEFSRSVALPAPVDEDKVDAQCRDGVLTVVMQKAADAKNHHIKVKG